MRKSIAAAGITASLLAGSFVGAAVFPSGIGFAQEAETEAPAVEARPEPGAWVRDTLAQLVTDGTLTQEQADAVFAALEANRPERPAGHHGHRGARFETVAEIIGIEVDALAEALRDGSTLAEVAEANGVSTQALVDALVAEAQDHLSQAVADGKLTQEQADEISETLVERITARVNGERPERPERPFGGDGPMRDRMHERPAPEADANA